MARTTINNGDSGLTVRTALNAMFTEIYAIGTAATQSGTSYTAAIGDANAYLRFTNSSAIAFTVPPNSSVAFPVNTEIEVEQAGAGIVTITAGAGVTINSRGGIMTTAGQYAVAALKKVATDTWTLTGDVG